MLHARKIVGRTFQFDESKRKLRSTYISADQSNLSNLCSITILVKHPKTAALTGGIASGKSTVSQMFQELGACLIDADIVARQVVEPGKAAWKEIVEYFGKKILLEDGALDRKKLGAIIFNHAEKRQILNQIVHPRVIQEIDEQERVCHEKQTERLVIVDVPLLIEAAMHESYEAIILVYVPEAIQLQRLMSRDKLPNKMPSPESDPKCPYQKKLTMLHMSFTTIKVPKILGDRCMSCIGTC